MMDGQILNILLIANEYRDYSKLEKMLQRFDHPYQLIWIDDNNFIAETACSGQFNIIFIDNYLGRVTGVDILDEIQRKGSRAPIILLRDRFSRISEDEILSKGAYAVLDKHRMNEKNLFETINQVIQYYQPASAWYPPSYLSSAYP